MSSKQKQIPAIRFEGFTDAWEQRKLEEDISVVGGATPSKSNPDYWNGPIVWLSSQEIKEKYVSQGTYTITKKAVDDNTTKMVKAGTPLIVSRSGILARLFPISIPTTDVAINQDIKALIFDLNIINTNFFVAQLQKNEDFILRSIVKTGTTVQSINMPDFYKLQLSFPSMNEQEKVGKFFQRLDDTIALHQRQLDNCKQLKSSMMQKIFNQELRFKDENGKDYPEWQKYDLSEIVDRVTRKNTGLISELPLTISAQYGLVDQLTFFNKTIAGVNLEAYYLLKNGEFAYNKSYSSGYPLGAIKRLDKYDAGLLSTLYICFSPRNNVDSDFLTQYFESTKWHKQIVNISGEGARNHGLLNIAVGDFFSTEHILPCKEEQQRIANLLYSLDKMIDLSKRKVESLNEQKKGLVRLMFV